MPELTLPELKRQWQKEKRKTELALLDLQQMRPEDQRRRFEGSLLQFTVSGLLTAQPSWLDFLVASGRESFGRVLSCPSPGHQLVDA